MDRRMFLRGAAATLVLPYLASALPRAARAATTPEARRMLFWFVPNGMIHDVMTPTLLGAGYDLPAALMPLAPIQSRVTVLSGLQNNAANQNTYGTHEGCMASLLSDNEVGDTYGTSLDAAITADQFVAAALGTTTPFPSLALSAGEVGLAASGNIGTYYNTLSYAGPQTPIATLGDPGVVFDRMFAGEDPEATAEDIERRMALRKSVLDGLVDRTAKLESKLNAEDRAKLDQYTTGVRELEVRIEALAELECPQPEKPQAGLGFQGKVAAMADLMVIALQCDYTRVLTFMLGPSTATTSYDFLGISADHHSLSHSYASNDTARGEMVTIQNWQVAQYVALLEKLAAVSEGSGDLLSNTMVALVTEFSDSNLHNSDPMTMLVAGGEAGGIAQGQHRLVPGSHGNLLHTMIDFVGVDPTGFGQNATGLLDLT